MSEELSELQQDALSETINIGVGRASRALAQLTKSEVAMSVPLIIHCLPGAVRGIVSPALFDSPDVCSVSRRVSGFEADVAMIFQGTQESMSSLIHGAVAIEAQKSALDEREGVAQKIGYLVIESCLDQIQSVLGRNIERSKLAYFAKLPEGVFYDNYSPIVPVIIVKIDIAVPKRGISGHLLCALTHQAANRMADGLDAIVIESQG